MSASFLALRNGKDMLFEGGIDICYETVQLLNRFSPLSAQDIRRQPVSRMENFRHWYSHLDKM